MCQPHDMIQHANTIQSKQNKLKSQKFTWVVPQAHYTMLKKKKEGEECNSENRRIQLFRKHEIYISIILYKKEQKKKKDDNNNNL